VFFLIYRRVVHCADCSGIMMEALTPPSQIIVLLLLLIFAHWDLMYADFSFYWRKMKFLADYCY
jgi:hypothetical protein